MPVPPILAPPPRSKYLDSHKEREGMFRLRLHLSMARLRSGIRHCVSMKMADPDFRQCKEYLQVEMEFILEIIGYIHIHGFRIKIPYLVQDLADNLFGMFHEVWGCEELFKDSVNQDFNALSDSVLLGRTKPYFYWWEPQFLRGATADNMPHFSKQLVCEHFIDYYNTVVKEQYGMFLKGEGELIPYLDTDDMVPGLREEAVINDNGSGGGTSGQGTGVRQPPHIDCGNCEVTKRTVQCVLQKLQIAQANMAMHIHEAEEAAARSCHIVNAYTQLEKILDDHEPFENGAPLPKKFLKKFPVHPQEDPNQENIDRKNIEIAKAHLSPSQITVAGKEYMGIVNDVTYRFLCFRELPQVYERSRQSREPLPSVQNPLPPPSDIILSAASDLHQGSQSVAQRDTIQEDHDEDDASADDDLLPEDLEEGGDSSDYDTTIPSDFVPGEDDSEEGERSTDEL